MGCMPRSRCHGYHASSTHDQPCAASELSAHEGLWCLRLRALMLQLLPKESSTRLDDPHRSPCPRKDHVPVGQTACDSLSQTAGSCLPPLMSHKWAHQSALTGRVSLMTCVGEPCPMHFLKQASRSLRASPLRVGALTTGGVCAPLSEIKGKLIFGS